MDAKTKSRLPPTEQPKRSEKPAEKVEPSERRPAEPGRKDDQAAIKPPEKPAPSMRERLRQHWILATVAAGVLILGLIAALLYWLDVRHYETTDDAFVAARSFSIAPKVGGYVTDIPVTDNQHVAAGQSLARIDQRDYKIAVDQAQGQVAAAQANIANIEAQIGSQQAQIDQAQAQVDQAEAQLKFSQQEQTRAQDLMQKGAGTVQREQQTNSDLNAQQAATARAKSALIAAQLQIKVLGRSMTARPPRWPRRSRNSIRPSSISPIPISSPRSPAPSRGSAAPRVRS